MVTGAIVGMFSLRAMAHLKKRDAGMHEILTLSAEHEVLMRTYVSCWSDVKFYEHQPCALDVVDLARTQGRQDPEIANILGVMGVFEEDCADTTSINLRTVEKTPELKRLRGIWCARPTSAVTSSHQP